MNSITSFESFQEEQTERYHQEARSCIQILSSVISHCINAKNSLTSFWGSEFNRVSLPGIPSHPDTGTFFRKPKQIPDTHSKLYHISLTDETEKNVMLWTKDGLESILIHPLSGNTKDATRFLSMLKNGVDITNECIWNHFFSNRNTKALIDSDRFLSLTIQLVQEHTFYQFMKQSVRNNLYDTIQQDMGELYNEYKKHYEMSANLMRCYKDFGASVKAVISFCGLTVAKLEEIYIKLVKQEEKRNKQEKKNKQKKEETDNRYYRQRLVESDRVRDKIIQTETHSRKRLVRNDLIEKLLIPQRKKESTYSDLYNNKSTDDEIVKHIYPGRFYHPVKKEEETIKCQICKNNKLIGQLNSLPCQHLSCSLCWKEYLNGRKDCQACTGNQGMVNESTEEGTMDDENSMQDENIY